MSAVAAGGNYATQRPSATTVTQRPSLRVVSHGARSAAAPGRGIRRAVLIGIAIGLIVIMRQLVSVGVTEGAYELAALNQQQVDLQRDAEFASEQLRVMDSPQNLATMAEKLGMISNAQPAYLRLSDAHVFGSPSGAEKSGQGAVPIANDLVKQLGVNSVVVAATTAAQDEATTAPATEAESESGAVASGSEIPAPKTN